MEGLRCFHAFLSDVIAGEFVGRMHQSVVLVGVSNAREVVKFENYESQLASEVNWLGFLMHPVVACPKGPPRLQNGDDPDVVAARYRRPTNGRRLQNGKRKGGGGSRREGT
jgi:hypothetical protein